MSFNVIQENKILTKNSVFTVYDKTGQEATDLPAKSGIDIMFCLQSYQGLIIDRSLVY